MSDLQDILLDIAGLNVTFPSASGPVHVVRDVGFTLGRERLAIVGESGSGKSMTVRSLLGLAGPGARVTAERAAFRDANLLQLAPRELQAVRGRKIAMVVQDARQGLNPVRTVAQQIGEMLRLHGRSGQGSAQSEIVRLLDEVHIRDPKRVAGLYPHQLSGGMAQRVMIAMMLAGEPEILIADEATSALDAVVQRHILDLIDEQVKLRGMGLILISHDLELVSAYADRILVMYAGRIVETMSARDGYANAQHPYTRGLIACTPTLDHPGGLLGTLTRDPAWLQ